jgi:phosphohistidine phosphatase
MSPSSPDSSPRGGGRVLVVLRHGKAEAFGAEDHARHLIARGTREATGAGAWLASSGWVPTHAIVSSAARTQETWACLARGSGSPALPDISDAAYAASTDSAMEILRGAPEEASVLVLVGHNPTVSSLALLLDDGNPDPAALRALSGGLPTAGGAVFEVGVVWRDLDVGTARLVACYAP